jgi:hypothetical protein
MMAAAAGQAAAQMAVPGIQGDTSRLPPEALRANAAAGARLAAAAAQTITFPALGNIYVGVPVTLSATASSGLAVSYAVLSGNATIAGTMLTVNDINPVTIEANQAGDADFNAAAPVIQVVKAILGNARVFFGSSGEGGIADTTGGGQNLAAVINGSGTGGTLVGYVGNVGAGFVVNFTLDQGGFTAVTTSLPGGGAPGRTLTFAGSLAGGTLSGTIAELGLPFSVTADASSGPTSAAPGLYQAASATGGAMFVVIGTQSDAFGLAVTPNGVGAGAGAISADNAFALATTVGVPATLVGSIDSSTTVISGTIALGVGGATSFAGKAGQDSPIIVPGDLWVAAGASPSLGVSTLGHCQWQFNGVNLAGATGPTLTLPHVGADQAGLYTAVVVGTDGAISSSSASVGVTVAAHLVNFSSRSSVGTGSRILVAGFVVDGPVAKQILIRGVGPTLTDFAVDGALADPLLTLFDNTSTVIASNAGWNNPLTTGPSTSGAGAQPATALVFKQVHAFGLPEGSADGAMLATLPAAAYTAQVSGVNASTGIALVELYDADLGAPVSHLSNLSARSFVNTGSGVLVAGFVIAGASSETILIRGIGPALAAFGISGALAAPQLTLFDSNDAVVATNTGWGASPILGPSTVAAGVRSATTPIMNAVDAFSLPTGSSDCAMVVTLPPGAYTAQVSGLVQTTGIGLVEIYDVP